MINWVEWNENKGLYLDELILIVNDNTLEFLDAYKKHFICGSSVKHTQYYANYTLIFLYSRQTANIIFLGACQTSHR